MTVKIGESIPNFEAKTTEGTIQFYDWCSGFWCLFITHPTEFTPVCITELVRMASLKEEFSERNVKTIAISNNSLLSHLAWLNRIDNSEGTKINFPIIADETNKVSTIFDLMPPCADNISNARTVLIIDPDKKVRLTLDYPLSTGRNFYELLRIIDSLLITSNNNGATPVDWHYGEKIIASIINTQ
jgi:alkyl hydroperoxide reductase subunit AhpC